MEREISEQRQVLVVVHGDAWAVAFEQRKQAIVSCADCPTWCSPLLFLQESSALC